MTIGRRPAEGNSRIEDVKDPKPGWTPEPEPDEPKEVTESKQTYREIGQVVDMSIRIFVAATAFMEARGLKQEFTEYAREHFDIDPERMP